MGICSCTQSEMARVGHGNLFPARQLRRKRNDALRRRRRCPTLLHLLLSSTCLRCPILMRHLRAHHRCQIRRSISNSLLYRLLLSRHLLMWEDLHDPVPTHLNRRPLHLHPPLLLLHGFKLLLRPRHRLRHQHRQRHLRRCLHLPLSLLLLRRQRQHLLRLLCPRLHPHPPPHLRQHRRHRCRHPHQHQFQHQCHL